jgi:hypothetical protein
MGPSLAGPLMSAAVLLFASALVVQGMIDSTMWQISVASTVWAEAGEAIAREAVLTNCSPADANQCLSTPPPC